MPTPLIRSSDEKAESLWPDDDIRVSVDIAGWGRAHPNWPYPVRVLIEAVCEHDVPVGEFCERCARGE